MASSLSQLTGGGARVAPGSGDSVLGGLLEQVYSGEVGMVFCGMVAVFFLWVMVSGRSSGPAPPPPPNPEPRPGTEIDLAALRRARMSGREQELDRYG